MKKICCTLILLSMIVTNPIYSYTKWQTTKNSLQTGHCQLESNKIKVTVHTYHLDIEEEAVISTRGNVNWGDPNTLEISGEFKLTPGATMRSLLLWNGDKILKAKLLDRELADSIMDSIVNKTYKDPALIKYEGGNRYSFRIYPVSINNSRKVRVLYTVPLRSNKGRLKLEFLPAFTLGCQQVPTQIPVEFAPADTTPTTYIFQHGETIKSLQFGATYLIPFNHFHQGTDYYIYNPRPEPLAIIPDTTCNMNKAYAYTLEKTQAVGCYTALFATVPDTLKALINEFQLVKYTLEAKIQTTDNSYIRDVPVNSSFSIYIKSKSHWDGMIYWNVYDENGISKITHTQTFQTDIDPVKNVILPLLWGAKYSLVEGLGNMGGVFGFVDNKMSLLALERDTLSATETALYWEKGVPLLLPEEIFADTANLAIPKENIIIDITGSKSMTKDVLNHIAILIKPDNKIIIQLGDVNLKTLDVSIYDLKGKLIKQYKNMKVRDSKVQVNLPATMKGIFIMCITSDSMQVSKKLVLK